MEVQKPTQESLKHTSVLRVGTSFAQGTGQVAHLGIQAGVGDEERGKGIQGRQLRSRSPRAGPSRAICTRLLTSMVEKPSSLPATTAGLSFQGGFPEEVGVMPHTRYESFSQPLSSPGTSPC